MANKPSSSLQAELKIRPAKAQRGAEALGIFTVKDLIWHLPFRYEDRREVINISELVEKEKQTVIGKVIATSMHRIAKGRFIVETKIKDSTGVIKVTWFNRPWILREIKKGQSLMVYGVYRKNQFYPEEYDVGLTKPGEKLTPVYPSNENITSVKIRELIEKHKDVINEVEEFLPETIRTKLGFPERKVALTTLHFPTNIEDSRLARSRLAFDELLIWELTMLRKRHQRDTKNSIQLPASTKNGLVERWTENLPFVLTLDQKKAITIIDEDLSAPHSMQRLLMGDVGTGKTILALGAILRGVENGYQGAILAPTETLAEQHYDTIQKLLGKESVNVELLTGSIIGKKRESILNKLKNGDLQLIVGTHALLEDPVQFKNLGVVIVDEQHRFGVKQRSTLDKKGPGNKIPNVMHMSATPIPRSLAMTLYCDLDITQLRERPQQRVSVPTYIVSTEKQKARMYERMREEIATGRQVFVVCPLVEESELLQAKAATQEYEALQQGEFAQQRVALIHGQMKSSEKQAVMESFSSGQADVLVATSVIEVGIDVPNATVILVEDAHRYGIAQLHQLRGRVGRGEHPSFCFLAGKKSAPRLKALAENDDGFVLSELDLELRGQGEILGVKQSGISDFQIASLSDTELIEKANVIAKQIIADDANLEKTENQLILSELNQTYGSVA